MITPKELDDIVEEFKKSAIPTERCHFCKVPVYRLPFQETPSVDGKIMCLECLCMYAEYQKLQ